MMQPAGLADVEARIATLTGELAAAGQRLASLQTGLERSHRAWKHQADQAAASTAEDARKALQRDRKAIEANAEEARANAIRIVRTATEHNAPTYLAAPWSDGRWTSLLPAAPGEWLRVGSLETGNEAVPLMLPLSAGSWTASGADAAAFRTLVQNSLVRLLAAFDPPRIRAIVFDPDLTLDLAVFSAVRALSPASVPPAITSTEAFERALDELLKDIAEVDDRLTSAAQGTYWRALAAGHELATTIPLRVLVIGSRPSDLTDRGAARLAQVRRLAADRGLLVIEAAGADPFSGPGIEIGSAGAKATASTVAGIEWAVDAPAGDEFIRAVCTRIGDRPRQSLAPTVGFRDIVARIDDAWMAEADSALEAVIGTSDVGDLTVRLRGENPAMPNALVGGSTGQGKSNLLLVLIHSLAARYSPAELEMVLIDLKDGVEFARLGPTPQKRTWLPQVRALGLELDPDYSIAVLKWVAQQISERSERFKAAGTNSVAGYRRASGRTIPRLLIVVDEFQKLFEGDDDQVTEAAALMEDIARRGRSFGVHMVLASQAVTGIRGLAVKQDAIFGQFDNRISLRNTPVESQAFLGPQNLAAAQLEHRGQVVLNESKGAADGNRLGTVAYADDEYLDRLQADLFSQGHRDRPPAVFRASVFAPWNQPASLPASTGPTLALGLPIEMEPEPRRLTLGRAPNQGVAIVGSDRRLAVPVLARAALTAAQSLGPGAEVVVLDGDAIGPAPQPWLQRVIDRLVEDGCAVERVAGEDIRAKLAELASSTGGADLVVAVALDSVDLSTPAEPDYLIPSESLRDVVKSGPLSHTWTIGWWQSLSVLEEQLGYRAPGIRAWVFCAVSKDDLTSIAGHNVRQPTAYPRTVFFDRTGRIGAERLVPFDAADIIGEAPIG